MTKTKQVKRHLLMMKERGFDRYAAENYLRIHKLEDHMHMLDQIFKVILGIGSTII